jgi:hypothetical protein
MERRRILGLGAVALLITGVVVNAGQEPVLESTLARRAALLAARANLGGGSVPLLASTAVRVVGFAWHADDTPIVYPILRIRNLQDGGIEARTTGPASREFRFDTLSGGSYLIELLDSDRDILAVGQPLTVLSGETVGTFIRLGEVVVPNEVRQPGQSVPTVVQTAAAADVTAIGGGFAASRERQRGFASRAELSFLTAPLPRHLEMEVVVCDRMRHERNLTQLSRHTMCKKPSVVLARTALHGRCRIVWTMRAGRPDGR